MGSIVVWRTYVEYRGVSEVFIVREGCFVPIRVLFSYCQ